MREPFSASRAISSARTGTAISAAAVGVGTVNMTSASARITDNVTNFGTMNVMGSIGGQLNNRNIVQTSGDTTVGRLTTGGSNGSTTILQGHTLTSTLQAQNYTTTTISGTLRGLVAITASSTRAPISSMDL